MKLKWTNGPWKIGSSDGVGFGVENNDNHLVATTNVFDAHLISAAPDLYEALERMVATFKVLSPGDGWWQEEYDMALAALKKARGEK